MKDEEEKRAAAFIWSITALLLAFASMAALLMPERRSPRITIRCSSK